METQELKDLRLIIRPSRGSESLQLGELWQYRELLFFLVWRDVSVRYKQTILGIAWAIIQPFFTMVIFSIFFGGFVKIPSDGVPYPLFVLAALVPWTFFSGSLQDSSSSIVASNNLITKVYFPRLIIPLSTIFSQLVDFVLAFILMVVTMIAFGHLPTLNVIWLPFFLLLAMMTATGVGLWLSALNVQFRDVRYVVPFLAQAWLFITPIAYPSSLITEPWHTLYAINPMVGVVEGFRWALLGTATSPASLILVSTLVALGLLVTGLFYFQHVESSFADII